MKVKPRTYFIVSGIAALLFVVLFYLGINFWSYAIGIAIGALIRGFYEENKIAKELKNKN